MTTGIGHLCFVTNDLASGVQVGEPKPGLDQSWQVWIEDPDGNAIELHAYTPESWQTPHL